MLPVEKPSDYQLLSSELSASKKKNFADLLKNKFFLAGVVCIIATIVILLLFLRPSEELTSSPPVSVSPAVDADSDGDGVLDSEDWCPNTAQGAKVNKDGCGIVQIPPSGSKSRGPTSKFPTGENVSGGSSGGGAGVIPAAPTCKSDDDASPLGKEYVKSTCEDTNGLKEDACVELAGQGGIGSAVLTIEGFVSKITGRAIGDVVTVGGKNYKSVESSSLVLEYACESNSCTFGVISCLNGCQNGACKQPEQQPGFVQIVCSSGEKKCDGAKLKTCKADGSGWTELACQKGCDSVAKECNDICTGVNCPGFCDGDTRKYDGECVEGSCVYSSENCENGCDSLLAVCKGAPKICTPETKQCAGDSLRVCKADGTAWEEQEACSEGCLSGTCNICRPGMKECEANVFRTCKSDGSGWIERVCDDGLFCNGEETCDSFKGCLQGNPIVIDEGISCTTDMCDEINDIVLHSPDDSKCDDGLFCNGKEVCDQNLGCQSGGSLLLDDAFDCTADTCDETQDKILHTPDNSVCEDNDVCNGAETCSALIGCQQGAKLSCDDGLFCNGEEACNPAQGCITNLPLDVDDEIACTEDSCDEALDKIVHVTNNLLCNNNDVCDGVEKCTPTGCESGTDLSCNDNNACTEDSCNILTGCRNSQISCDDNNKCTADTCDSVKGCKQTEIVCNDNNKCTEDSCNSELGCNYESISCDDGKSCTADSCDSITGCKNVPKLCDFGCNEATGVCNACQVGRLRCSASGDSVEICEDGGGFVQLNACELGCGDNPATGESDPQCFTCPLSSAKCGVLEDDMSTSGTDESNIVAICNGFTWSPTTEYCAFGCKVDGTCDCPPGFEYYSDTKQCEAVEEGADGTGSNYILPGSGSALLGLATRTGGSGKTCAHIGEPCAFYEGKCRTSRGDVCVDRSGQECTQQTIGGQNLCVAPGSTQEHYTVCREPQGYDYKGEVIDTLTKPYFFYDKCELDGSLTEYSCGPAGKVVGEKHACSTTCSEGKCTVCVPEGESCKNNVLMKCNSEGSKWELADLPCEFGCDATTNQCYTCQKGAKRCSPGRVYLETCVDRREWKSSLSDRCEFGCNAEQEKCNVCVPDEKQCGRFLDSLPDFDPGDNRIFECSDDGSGWVFLEYCPDDHWCDSDPHNNWAGGCRICAPDESMCEGNTLKRCANSYDFQDSLGKIHPGWDWVREGCEKGCSEGKCNICTPGELQCSEDVKTLQTCAGANWEDSENCEFGCDSLTNSCKPDPCENVNCPDVCETGSRKHEGTCASGKCEYKVESCLNGCSLAGEYAECNICSINSIRCSDGNLEKCAGTTWDVLTDRVCSYGCGINPTTQQPACKTCEQGSKRCEGGTVYTCNSDGFTESVEICSDGCEESESDASCYRCKPGGIKCDVDGTLKICTGYDWDDEHDDCNSLGCGELSGVPTCKKCIPGETRCDGGKLYKCNADGFTETPTECQYGCHDEGEGSALCLACSPGSTKCCSTSSLTEELATTFAIFDNNPGPNNVWVPLQALSGFISMGPPWRQYFDNFCKANGYAGLADESAYPYYASSSYGDYAYTWITGRLDGKNMIKDSGALAYNAPAITKVKCVKDVQNCANRYDVTSVVQTCEDGFNWISESCAFGCGLENNELACHVCGPSKKWCEGGELHSCSPDGFAETVDDCNGYGCENNACKEGPPCNKNEDCGEACSQSGGIESECRCYKPDSAKLGVCIDPSYKDRRPADQCGSHSECDSGKQCRYDLYPAVCESICSGGTKQCSTDAQGNAILRACKADGSGWVDQSCPYGCSGGSCELCTPDDCSDGQVCINDKCAADIFATASVSCDTTSQSGYNANGDVMASAQRLIATYSDGTVKVYQCHGGRNTCNADIKACCTDGTSTLDCFQPTDWYLLRKTCYNNNIVWDSSEKSLTYEFCDGGCSVVDGNPICYIPTTACNGKDVWTKNPYTDQFISIVNPPCALGCREAEYSCGSAAGYPFYCNNDKAKQGLAECCDWSSSGGYTNCKTRVGTNPQTDEVTCIFASPQRIKLGDSAKCCDLLDTPRCINGDLRKVDECGNGGSIIISCGGSDCGTDSSTGEAYCCGSQTKEVCYDRHIYREDACGTLSYWPVKLCSYGCTGIGAPAQEITCDNSRPYCNFDKATQGVGECCAKHGPYSDCVRVDSVNIEESVACVSTNTFPQHVKLTPIDEIATCCEKTEVEDACKDGNVWVKDDCGWEYQKQYCPHGCDTHPDLGVAKCKVCAPNSKECSGNYVKTCNSNGYDYDLTSCQFGCENGDCIPPPASAPAPVCSTPMYWGNTVAGESRYGQRVVKYSLNSQGVTEAKMYQCGSTSASVNSRRYCSTGAAECCDWSSSAGYSSCSAVAGSQRLRKTCSGNTLRWDSAYQDASMVIEHCASGCEIVNGEGQCKTVGTGAATFTQSISIKVPTNIKNAFLRLLAFLYAF